MGVEAHRSLPWYHGITRQQWTVLLIASLGWVFDTFEGQVYVSSMNEAMPDLLPGIDRLDPAERAGRLAYFNNIAFGAFLLGGAAGGVAFGILGDRIGRVRALILTIATYSAFTFVSAFSTEWWHLVGFRFLVAMGVGGEWAVAASLVAEAFPKRARAWSLAIFHASSVFGTWLAVAVGAFIVAGREFRLPFAGEEAVASWRVGFAAGAAPALLILLIRWKLRGETEAWSKSRLKSGGQAGRAVELFRSDLRRRTLVGISLAAIGLATFWGVHIYGKDLLRAEMEKRIVVESLPGIASDLASDELFARLKRWEMLGMLLASGGAAPACWRSVRSQRASVGEGRLSSTISPALGPGWHCSSGFTRLPRCLSRFRCSASSRSACMPAMQSIFRNCFPRGSEAPGRGSASTSPGSSRPPCCSSPAGSSGTLE